MVEYIAEQWDIDRLEYLEQRLRTYNPTTYELHLIAFDLRVEIQKLKRQERKDG